MLKHLIIVAFLILYNRYLIRLDDEFLYRHMVDFAAANNLLLFGCTTFVSLVLVVGAYLSLEGTLYRMVYSVSKIFMLISQMLIALVCVYNIYFWFGLEYNFIGDLSYLSFMILFELLIATCVALRFIDFNYHFQNTLVEAITMSIISVLFVELLGPAYLL